MPEHPQWFENVQTSNRSAEQLARRLRFENLVDFITTLPRRTRVLEVGAGDSAFGPEVAERRPDILWLQYDFSYSHEGVAGPNSNLLYVPGGATKLCEDQRVVNRGPFGVVVSYWLLPHLSLYEDEPAKKVVRAMYRLTAPGGKLWIGPDLQHYPIRKYAQAFEKDSYEDVEGLTERVVEQTRATGLTRASLLLGNEVTTPFYGTSRYLRQRPDGGHELFDPATQEYVRPFTRRGMRLIGGVAAKSARYLVVNGGFPPHNNTYEDRTW